MNFSFMNKKEIPGNHPGWAVQFSDGTWLGGAHGWFRTNDAGLADIYDSEEDARDALEYARDGNKEYYNLDSKIILAWEP